MKTNEENNNYPRIMNFVWILLGICLIEGSSCATRYGIGEQRSLSTESHPIKLVDIPSDNEDDHRRKSLHDIIPGNEATSTQDHFSARLISTIQNVVTQIISNPQTISFLLTLLPTFPPVAIIGSFAMVILSILQNPTILKFLQGILPKLNPFADSFKSVSMPKYFENYDGTNIGEFNLINKGVKYGSKFADFALKELNLKNLNLQELDSLTNSQPQRIRNKMPKSLGQINGDELVFGDKRNVVRGGKERKRAIPFIEFQ